MQSSPSDFIRGALYGLAAVCIWAAAASSLKKA